MDEACDGGLQKCDEVAIKPAAVATALEVAPVAPPLPPSGPAAPARKSYLPAWLLSSRKTLEASRTHLSEFMTGMNELKGRLKEFDVILNAKPAPPAVVAPAVDPPLLQFARYSQCTRAIDLACRFPADAWLYTTGTRH